MLSSLFFSSIETHMQLIQYCRDFLTKNFEPGARIPCSLCHVTKVYFPLDSKPRHYDAMEHVLSHVSPPAFRCCLCDSATTTKTETTMKEHIRREHSKMPTGSHYRNDLAKYQEKVIDVIHTCFGGKGQAIA